MHQRYRVLALGLQALIFLALGQGSRPVEAHVGAEAPLAPACPLGGPLGLLPPGPGCGQPKLPPACPDDPPVPVVTLKVRVPAQAKIGNDIEYRICLENCSPAAAHHVVVRNAIPKNARFVKAQPEPTKKDPELQWHLGTLQGGERRVITLVLAPTGTEDITNCARVQFEYGQCVTTRLSALPLPGQGDLTVRLSGPKQQYLNLAARYFLTVANPGAAPADNVLLTASLPDKATFLKASGEGKFLAGQVAWLLGTIQPGARKTVELVLRAKNPGEICIEARALADRGLTAQDKLCTHFLPGVSALTQEMVDRHDPIEVGGETSYPITIRNQGSTAVTNIRIKTIVPDGLMFLSAKGPTAFQNGGKVPEGQVILFEPLPSLAVGDQANYEVLVKAVRPGDVRFRMELNADQLKEGGPVREEESTTIYADTDAPKVPPPPKLGVFE